MRLARRALTPACPESERPRAPRSVPQVALAVASVVLAVAFVAGCSSNPESPDDGASQPEHQLEWGIYRLDLSSDDVELVYTTDNALSRIDLSGDGSKLVFREDFGPDDFTDAEICVIGTNGSGRERLTTNDYLDAYPCWSPDDTHILFLSWPGYPDGTMDIYLMDADGGNPSLLYDSGTHDGDCDWEGDRITFTQHSQVWIMDDDGTNATQVTDYALAGLWGAADFPFGDYDPRLRPQGDVICFDRMIDDQVQSGNYDFFTITPEGGSETQITDTGYSQFIAEWSHAGDRLIFTVGAVQEDGLFHIYMMNADGSDYHDITPSWWPGTFLCSHAIFSEDDTSIYFVGQWYEAT
jgi:Tol biopolymer transport system component